jgi:hypoxanthine phosphoribosyltransferase
LLRKSSESEDLIELISKGEIQKRVNDLAHEIDSDYSSKTPVLVGILKGAFVFLADLSRCLTIEHEIDFMTVSSYSDKSDMPEELELLSGLQREIKGEDVLIVEDIVDTGRTLRYIYQCLRDREPASLAIVTLLDKRERREVDIDIRYRGFEIADHFVFGYGLDQAERFRGLPYIAYKDEEKRI